MALSRGLSTLISSWQRVSSSELAFNVRGVSRANGAAYSRFSFTGRPFSTKEESEAASQSNAGADTPLLIYEAGPIAGTVRRVKAVSLTSCILSIAAAPATAMYGTMDVGAGSKLLVAGSMVFFGVGTTAALHYISKPYIRKMWLHPQTSSLEVEVLSIFGLTQRRQFLLDDVVPLRRPRLAASFEAKGQPYYVDELLMDDDILAILFPWKHSRGQPPEKTEDTESNR
eukprot:jgi/Mesvir1/19577/Mv09880-RA.1